MNAQSLKRSVIATVVASALVGAYSINNGGASWLANAATGSTIKTQSTDSATVPAAPVVSVAGAA